MKISIRSRLLILLGTYLYGDPQAWGLNCTSEEFYAMPNERPQLSPKFLHPQVAAEWEVMHRNVLVDRVRQRVFKHIALCACVASLAVFTVGSVGIKGIVKTKELASSVQSKLASSHDREARLEAIKNEANELVSQAKTGAITKDEYEQRSKQLRYEYQTLQGETK